MITLLAVILGFLLTSLVGNSLLQNWQYRTWLNQQRFLGEEKDYMAMQDLWREVSELSGARLTRMNRLYAAQNLPDETKIQERFSAYDSIVAEWNEKYLSFSVRLARFTSSGLYVLEKQVQPKFVAAGALLERCTKQRLSTHQLNRPLINTIRSELDGLSHLLFVFHRTMLIEIQKQKARTYKGIYLELSESTLTKFSNWELVKAIFHPGIKPFRVIRSSFDFASPDGSG
jgi:hypothetical protein